MRSASDLEQRLRDLIDPICRTHRVSCIQVRYAQEPGGGLLRVMIERDDVDGLDSDGQGGVRLDDCVAVSRDVSVALDAQDAIAGRYRLEVTSPGLERPLLKPEDFERFKGREVKLQTLLPIERQRRFQGVLKGLVDDQVQLEQGGDVVSIALDNVSKANLVFHFGEKKGNKGERHAER